MLRTVSSVLDERVPVVNIALDILIVGMATAAGLTTGWLLRPSKKSIADTSDWRIQALQYKEQVAAALNETSTVRNQVAFAKGEAASFKLEAAQAKRDLQSAREEAARAQDALSQVQYLAARIAA